MEDILDSDFYRQLPEDAQTVFSLLRNKWNLKPGKVRLLAHEWGPFMGREELEKALKILESYNILKKAGGYYILPLKNKRFRLRLDIK